VARAAEAMSITRPWQEPLPAGAQIPRLRGLPLAVVASSLGAARGWRGAIRGHAEANPTQARARARGDELDEARVRRLVERTKQGDAEAFGELFEAFQPDVLRLCERLLGSRPDAEDATHETFLKARNGLGSYDAGRRLRPWLLGIAAHHALDRLRRRATEQRLFEDDALTETLASPGPSPLQGELDAARRREVLAAIDTLPDRYRAPIVLRYYADLEFDTIAELLSVSKNQVATLLLRGRRSLRETLTADPGERPR